MSVIDSHCHAWERWPYSPNVPDPESRASIDQLLFEMDANGVDQAILVSAEIQNNPNNNDYVARQIASHPDRLHQFADVDSTWSSLHHTPGAADRLRAAVARWPIRGFTHYLDSNEDAAWLDESADGREFFGVAAELGLIASLSLHPGHHHELRKVAERYPQLVIMIHHLGHINADDGADGESLGELLQTARHPNVHVKFSGFRYLTRGPVWDFPYHSTHDTIHRIYRAYGPHRMCWGSDYPVVRSSMTYRQSLETVRSHCTFIAADEMQDVLGATMGRLLA